MAFDAIVTTFVACPIPVVLSKTCGGRDYCVTTVSRVLSFKMKYDKFLWHVYNSKVTLTTQFKSEFLPLNSNMKGVSQVYELWQYRKIKL